MMLRISCPHVSVCHLESITSTTLTASGRGTVGTAFGAVITFGTRGRACWARLARRRLAPYLPAEHGSGADESSKHE
eukprot:480288-Prymnesium_polylepis.1